MDKLIALLQAAKTLTWAKVSKILALSFGLVVCYILLLNGHSIYNSIATNKLRTPDKPIVISLSKETKRTIDETVEKSELINGIHVLNVNFVLNTRFSAYMKTDNPKFSALYQDWETTKVGDQPLFTTNSASNARIVQLINGEFICSDYADTVGPTIWTDSEKIIKTVCSVSIPPYYGKFAGYINFYLNRKPTTDEIAVIRSSAVAISNTIYERDVK